MSGVLNMGSSKITNLANGTNAGDAINKDQLDQKANKSQNNWVDFTNFINGWASDTNFPVQYFKDDFGIVHWRGRLVTTNATQSVISPSGSIPDDLAPPPDLSGIGQSVYQFIVSGYDGGSLIIPITFSILTAERTGRIQMGIDDFDALPKSPVGWIQLDHISYDTRGF